MNSNQMNYPSAKPRGARFSITFRPWFHLLVFVLFFALSPCLSAADEPSALAGEKPLVISIASNYSPFTVISPTGEATGLFVEMWRLWSRQTGAPVEFLAEDWIGALGTVKDGRADVHAGLFINDYRSEWLAFSEPIHEIRTSLFFRNGTDPDRSLENMSGRKVGAITGFYQLQYLRDNFPDIEAVGYPDGRELVLALLKGEVEAILNENLMVAADLAYFGIPGGLQRGSQCAFSNPVVAAVRKDRAGLLARINEGFRDIPAELLSQLEDRWLPDPEEHYYSLQEGSVSLTDAEAEWIETHPVIRIAVTNFIKPVDILDADGRYTGLNADLMNELRRTTNADIVPQFFSRWSDVVASVMAGETDAAFSLSRTPEREIKLLFTKPYASEPVIVVARDDEEAITSWQDLRDKKVALAKGVAVEGEVRSIIGNGQVVACDDDAEALRLVGEGQADAFVGNMRPFINAQRSSRVANLKIVLTHNAESGTLRIGVPKSKPEIFNILRKGLNAISPKTLSDIRNRWLYPDTTGEVEAGVSLTPEEQSWIKNHAGPVKVGAEMDWPPFDFVSDEVPTGLSNDLVRLAAEKVGLPIEFVHGFAWSALVDRFNAGEIQVLPAVYQTPKRKRTMVFTTSYASNPSVMVARTDRDDLQRIDDLKGRQVAIVSGFATADVMKERFPEIKQVAFPNVEAGLKAVSLGKVDAFIGSLGVISYITERTVIPDITIVGEVWLKTRQETQLHMGVLQENVLLRDILQKGLDAVTGDELRKLKQQWLPLAVASGKKEPEIPLTDEERAWLKQHPEIRLGIDSDWPPIEFINEDNEYSGISAGFARILENRLGLSFRPAEGLPWLEVVRKFKDKELDALGSVAPTPQREKYMLFTQPYASFPAVIITRKDAPFVGAVGDLSGKTVGVVEGYAIHDYLTNKFPELQLVEGENVSQLLQSLSAGEMDAVIANLAVATYAMDAQGLTNLKIAAPADYTYDLCIGVRKDWPELVGILNKALASITESEKAVIKNRWVSVQYVQGLELVTILKWAVPILVGFVLVLFFIVQWNRKLNREIGERRKMERELRNSQRLMSDIINSLPFWVSVKDSEGKYLLVNRLQAEEHNSSVEEFLGRVTTDTVELSPGGLNEMVQRDRRVMESGESLEVPEYTVTRGDEERVRRLVKIPWRAEDDTVIGVISWSEDITQRKQVEQEIIEAKHKAEEATRAKSDFLANMSHEIRTPMNAIIGMSHLALKTDLEPKQYDYLKKIEASAKSLLGIINDILDFSKIEAGKLDMEAVDFDLNEVLQNVANMITVKAQEKEGLEVLFQIDPAVPRFLIGDPLRVGQVLINLGNNAVKFTEDGEIVVKARLVERSADFVTVRFSVKDSGIGMTEEHRSRLFQAFSQADTSTTRKYGGTGLGLTISKRLVEMMKGDIRVESEPGMGSEFIFTAVFGLGEEREVEKLSLSEDLLTLRVLVVDDNGTARQILTEMLESFEFKVESARSGTEALALLESAAPDHPYDLVLMDWQMPEPDGVETCRRIRDQLQWSPQPRIILVTAYAVDEAMEAARDVELDGVLVKPASQSGLLNAVMQAFGKVEAQKWTGSQRDREAEMARAIRGARILLVEDNEINQEVAREILEGAGLLVRIAEDGQKGVEALEGEEFDLVLMDIQMPVMDGYQATREIRKNPKHRKLPIIAMTANAMTQDKENAAEAGMDGHVSKPIDIKELFSTLLKWIEPGDRAVPMEEAGSESIPAGREAAENDIVEIPGIDTAAGLKRMGGNARLYRKLLAKYRESNTDTAAQVRQALAAGDFELARRLAHTVKGVSGNIGALEMQASAARVESAIKQDETPPEESLLEFETRLADLLAALKGVDGRAEEIAGPPVETEIDREKAGLLIPRLIELLEDDDLDAADVLDELQSHLGGPSARLAAVIGDLIEGYDFGGAALKARELADQLGIES